MIFPVIVFSVLLADQFLKLLVVHFLQPNQSISIIKNVFQLTYVRNPGAAFGLFAHRTGFLVLAALVVIVLILVILHNLQGEHFWLRVALALQTGGALGNLTDRLRLGYIIDFLDFRFWPVFNFADMAIVVGIGLLILDLTLVSREKGD